MIFLSIVIPTANLMILLFLIYYFANVQKQKKTLEEKLNQLTKKEVKIDSDYHQIVDASLSKERKILEDATKEANTILTSTKYVSDSYKKAMDESLQKMINDVLQQAAVSAGDVLGKHKNSLNQISLNSLNNFQNITKQFEADMQKQMQDFRLTLLPNLQKELDLYKQQKIKDANKTVNAIITDVSQKSLNKIIPLEDHQTLIIESLQKCLKEGLFD